MNQYSQNMINMLTYCMHNIYITGKQQVGKTRVVAALADIPYINKTTIDIHAHKLCDGAQLIDTPLVLKPALMEQYPASVVYIVLNGNYPLDHLDLEHIQKIRKMHLNFEFLLCFNTQYADEIINELPRDSIVHHLTNQRQIKSFRRKLIAQYCSKTEVDENIDDSTEEVSEPMELTWTLLGKENAGKSTLFNVLLGYDRNVVSDVPGTTQASVYEQLTVGGIKDTAGIKKINNDYLYKLLDKNSAILFIIDAKTGVTKQDKQLLSRIHNSGLGCIICVNKIDLQPKYDKDELEHIFKHIPIVEISAKDKKNIRGLRNEMRLLQRRLNQKLNTKILNNWIHDNKHTFHLVKIKYMRHNSRFPYSFSCFTTPAILPQDQISYIRNLITNAFNLRGICFQLNIKAARSMERAQQKPEFLKQMKKNKMKKFK